MLPYSFIGAWTYTNGSSLTAQSIPMTDRPDWVFVKDITNWGKASTAANPIYSEWFSSMTSGSFLGLGQPSSGTPANVTTYATQGASGGFTFIDQSNPPTFSNVSVSAVNDSSFIVLTSNTAGINVGDMVRLINVTGMLQLSGPNLYQVTAVSAGVSITLGYVATAVAAGLTVSASGTTGFIKKVYPGAFYPNVLPVLYITQATQAKVYFGRQNNFTPGELVDFQIPTTYGMSALSNLTAQGGSGALSNSPAGAARVLSVINSSTESSIVIDYDTSGLPTFVIPASASFANGASPASCFPAGSGVIPLNGSATIPASPPGTNLVDAFDNRSQYLMQIGTSACGVANATMQVFAFKADFVNAVTNA